MLLLLLTLSGVVYLVAMYRMDALREFAGLTEPASFPEEAVNVTDPYTIVSGEYEIDSDTSTVYWEGGRPAIIGDGHTGAIDRVTGEIHVDDNFIESNAEIRLDMTSFYVDPIIRENGNQAAAERAALEERLAGPNFLNIGTYPEATLRIHGLESVPNTTNVFTISGRLTLRGVAQDITFPATIYMKDDMLAVSARFSIDRTQWGMTAYSESIIGKLAENAISDEVEISLELHAHPVE